VAIPRQVTGGHCAHPRFIFTRVDCKVSEGATYDAVVVSGSAILPETIPGECEQLVFPAGQTSGTVAMTLQCSIIGPKTDTTCTSMNGVRNHTRASRLTDMTLRSLLTVRFLLTNGTDDLYSSDFEFTPTLVPSIDSNTVFRRALALDYQAVMAGTVYLHNPSTGQLCPNGHIACPNSRNRWTCKDVRSMADSCGAW
jgi:hypothetical protein